MSDCEVQGESTPRSEIVQSIVQNLNRVVCIETTATVAEAARKMQEHDVGSVVVVDGEGKVAGIFTDRDATGLVAEGADVSATVSGRMTTFVVTCSLSTPISDLFRIMSGHRIRHVPVVQEGRPVGMVSSHDLMAYELKASKAIVQRQSMLLSELASAPRGGQPVPRDRDLLGGTLPTDLLPPSLTTYDLEPVEKGTLTHTVV